MPFAHSGHTTPHSDVDHPHPISYSPIPFVESPKPLSIITIPDNPTYLDKNTQTSPNKTPHCPIHPHHLSAPIFTGPLFSRQNMNPPDLPSALELWTLLQDPNLVTPMHAHCKLHSPLLTLYRAYHNLIDLEQYPNMQTVRWLIEANLVKTLYQLGALTLLWKLKRAPSTPKKQLFCRKYYQLGCYIQTIKLECRTLVEQVLSLKSWSLYWTAQMQSGQLCLDDLTVIQRTYDDKGSECSRFRRLLVMISR